MKRSIIVSALAMLAIFTGVALSGQDNFGNNNPNMPTTVTNVSATITQPNYGPDGSVEGFLVANSTGGTNSLLTFLGAICGGFGTLGVATNSITYSGTEFTPSSGPSLVQVTSFTNNTTKASYTAPTRGTKPIAYGPTAGTIQQLNYGEGGSIDGFVFAPSSGSPIFIPVGVRAGSALASALTVGAAVTVTGTTTPSLSACAATGSLEVVDPSNLLIAGQNYVITGGGFGGAFGGFGSLGGHH